MLKPWNPENLELRILESWDSEIGQNLEFRILESYNLEIAQHIKFRIVESWNLEICQNFELKCYYDQNLMSSLSQKRFLFSLSEVVVPVLVIEMNFGAL